MQLIINNNPYLLKTLNHSTATLIKQHLPLAGKAICVPGEIYFLIDLNLDIKENLKEVFTIGDIVYWRAQNSDKYAIALFTGNTRFGDGTQARAVSPASLFARLDAGISTLAAIKNDDSIKLTSDN